MCKLLVVKDPFKKQGKVCYFDTPRVHLDQPCHLNSPRYRSLPLRYLHYLKSTKMVYNQCRLETGCECPDPSFSRPSHGYPWSSHDPRTSPAFLDQRRGWFGNRNPSPRFSVGDDSHSNFIVIDSELARRTERGGGDCSPLQPRGGSGRRL